MSNAVEAPKKSPLLDDIRALLAEPRELWLVLTTKLLEYVGVFSLLYVLTLWLSMDLGMGDERAGWWAGLFSSITSICGFFIGFVADSIGFRAAMILAFAASSIARLSMSFGKGLALPIFGLMLLGLGVGAGTPAMNAALRRYTTPRTRSLAFALYYTSINVGGMIAGFLVDACRTRFADPVTHEQIFRDIRLPLIGTMRMSAYGMVFFVGAMCSIVAFVVACLLRRGIDAEKLAEARARSANADATPIAVDEAPRKMPWTIAWELMREKPFWRFMLFVGLLSLVKLIFQHFHFTWPKYVLREMGESFPLGKFQAINPVAIIIVVPIATALTRHRSAFRCIVAGSFVSAMSMFVLMGAATYTTQILAIAFLTVGEAVWSPRIYEYTAAIAPKGREASYMGLSTLPYFLAKMIAGPMSGILLARYCPAQGERHSSIMWLVIALFTLMGPVLIVAFRSIIEKRDAPSPAVAPPAPAPAAEGAS